MKHGYTLIEILVVISVMAILVTVGYSSFRDYSRNQFVKNVAREIVGDLRVAQDMTLASKKPNNANCNSPNTLNGVRVEFSGAGYQIIADCSGGDVSVFQKTVAPATLYTSAPSSVTYLPLARGTDLTAEKIVSVCSDGRGVGVTISSVGEISETDPDCTAPSGGSETPSWWDSAGTIVRTVWCFALWLLSLLGGTVPTYCDPYV